MVVLVPGQHGCLATMTMARALLAAASVVLAHAMVQWPDVEGLNVRVQPSKWQTAPGTVNFEDFNTNL